MKKTKEQLELEVAALGHALLEAKKTSDNTLAQLQEASRQLSDIDKPVISENMVDELRRAINNSIEGHNFNDPENYVVDFGIDYRNCLTLDSIEFDQADTLSEAISMAIEDLFNVEIDYEEHNVQR
jgi:hypothetical protein